MRSNTMPAQAIEVHGDAEEASWESKMLQLKS